MAAIRKLQELKNISKDVKEIRKTLNKTYYNYKKIATW